MNLDKKTVHCSSDTALCDPISSESREAFQSLVCTCYNAASRSWSPNFLFQLPPYPVLKCSSTQVHRNLNTSDINQSKSIFCYNTIKNSPKFSAIELADCNDDIASTGDNTFIIFMFSFSPSFLVYPNEWPESQNR